MIIVGINFVLVFTVIIGTYWMFVLRPEAASRTALRRRVGMRVPLVQRESGAAVIREERRFSGVDALHNALTRMQGFVVPVQELIDEAGLTMTPGTLLLTSGCLALSVYL